MNLSKLAGIVGMRLTLDHDKAEDRCCAIFPGYGKTIAVLPLNTVDAVMTSGGMLVYKDDEDELRAVQVPDHREIYAYASTLPDPPTSVMIKPSECITSSNLKASSIKIGGYPYQSSSVNRGGIVSASVVPDQLARTMSDLAMKWVYPEEYRWHTVERRKAVAQSAPDQQVKKQENAMADRPIEDKVRVLVEELTAEFMKREVSPLIRQLAKMAALNGRLAQQIEKLEIVEKGQSNVIAAKRPHPAANLRDEGTETFEITWSDRGGLPNNLASLDNPFSARRR